MFFGSKTSPGERTRVETRAYVQAGPQTVSSKITLGHTVSTTETVETPILFSCEATNSH